MHFYWSAGVLFDWNFQEILHSKIGVNPDPEKVVCNPIPDLILTIWWGVDVLLVWLDVGLAWSVRATPRWLRIERGAVTLATFIVFFGATVLAIKVGPSVRLLGILMAVTVLTCYFLRIVLRPMEPESLSAFLYISFFRLLNLFRAWHQLPTILGVMNLAALREVLRARNLHSTSKDPEGKEVIPVSNAARRTAPPTFTPELLTARQDDGYFDDLHDPEMGAASECTPIPFTPPGAPLPNPLVLPGEIEKSHPGARFGRNVPLDEGHPDPEPQLREPNPREVSNRLLARDTFKPAGILNYLAAAWIQFETHDWFFHGNPVKGNEFRIDIDPNDKQWGPGPMLIRRTPPDPTRRPKDGPWPPTYVNAESHWWDGSQVYGSDPATVRRLRTDPDEPSGALLPNGQLQIDPKTNLLPIDPGTRLDMSGFTGNWWIGLTLLHTLFTREHNVLCEHLRHEYPSWPDDRVFHTARLVNAALMAKIHTVEWTCAILPNPVLQIGMNANWWGILSANVKKSFGRISENEGFSGILGSETNHHAAPFAFTEEFVAVYRMHPLMRHRAAPYRRRLRRRHGRHARPAERGGQSSCHPGAGPRSDRRPGACVHREPGRLVLLLRDL